VNLFKKFIFNSEAERLLDEYITKQNQYMNLLTKEEHDMDP